MKALFESLKPGDKDWALAHLIDPEKLPRHIGIIMDGNGRWASRRKLPRVAGHKAGIDSVRAVVETAARMGVSAVTLYAFSAENWKRPKAEVDALWGLLHTYIRRELATLMKNNIRMCPIGRLHELPPQVRTDLEGATEATSGNTGLQVNFAINYSGRAEIADAVNAAIAEARDAGTLDRFRVDEETISSRLYTAGIADLDLMIRTSGEMRISNFLLWQVAYSELYVTTTLWPDFRRTDLLEAVLDYQKRDRRFGGLNKDQGAPPAREEQLAEALGTPTK
jgi:undecaprenyl diphosphate synthase